MTLDHSGCLYHEAVLSLWVYSEHYVVFGSYLLAYSCYTLLNTETHICIYKSNVINGLFFKFKRDVLGRRIKGCFYEQTCFTLDECIKIHNELHITVKTANQIFDRRTDSSPALQIREPIDI